MEPVGLLLMEQLKHQLSGISTSKDVLIKLM